MPDFAQDRDAALEEIDRLQRLVQEYSPGKKSVFVVVNDEGGWCALSPSGFKFWSTREAAEKARNKLWAPNPAPLWCRVLELIPGRVE